MNIFSKSLGFCTAILLCVSGPVSAQTRTAYLEAFSGQWVVFDPTYSTSPAPCSLELTAEIELKGVVDESQLRPTVAVHNCVAPLDAARAWDILDGQLALYSAENVLITRLGGDQSRVTGDLEGGFRSVVLERAAGGVGNGQFSKALRKHRCIYKGFSSECASKEELALPVFADAGGVVASIGILVNLTVREHPRASARSVGTLSQGTCLKVNFCTTASDGIWCRARFGEASGWVTKTTLRQGEWPILTFSNICEGS